MLPMGDTHACVRALRSERDLVGSCVCAALLCMTVASCIVKTVPFFRVLGEHGKMMERRSSQQQHHLLRWLYVPKSYFIHMYSWGLMLNAMLFYERFATIVSFKTLPATAYSSTECIMQLLFTVHLFRRLLECAFMTIYGDSKMHIAGLAVGIVHYTICSLCIFILAPPAYTASAPVSAARGNNTAAKAAGVCLFLAANCCQYMCHKKLYETKKCQMGMMYTKKNDEYKITHTLPQQKTVGLSLYAVPEGIMFSYVCCPHYTAEILIYLSMYMLIPCPAMLCLLVWVTSNLTVVSCNQYDFYWARFKSSVGYPYSHTKRIIPFIL